MEELKFGDRIEIHNKWPLPRSRVVLERGGCWFEIASEGAWLLSCDHQPFREAENERGNFGLRGLKTKNVHRKVSLSRCFTWYGTRRAVPWLEARSSAV
jgi:hypothetical protein